MNAPTSSSTPATGRVVSLYLPRWLTDRWQRESSGRPRDPATIAESADTLLAVLGRDGRKRVVVAVSARAHAAGIQPGMAATMAQALVAGLVCIDADPAGDRAGLERLGLWLLRYSPVVASDPPDGLMIDIGGAAHLHGGDLAIANDIVARLAAVGVTARAACASTYGAAHALARYVADPVLIAGAFDTGSLLAELPVSALRLAAAEVDALRRLGFDRIGELAATPRGPLALRFGSDVGRRLDQMFGRASEPFELVEAPALIRVRQNFAEPIAAPETIARYIAKLVGQLCTALEAKGRGARRLDLLFVRVDDAVQAVRVGTAKPVRDVKRLTRLLCERIETVSPGFGIEAMILSAALAEPLDYRAGLSTLVDAAVPDISELIDTLANRVGNGRLYRLTPVASDVPERSTRRVAALAPAVPAASLPIAQGASRSTGTVSRSRSQPQLLAESQAEWPTVDWPRPTRLLSPPERVETLALLPDHPPAAFTWRGIRRRIRRADGPERLFGEWWKRDAEVAAVRDYFQVEDDAGERFWLFRAGDGEDPVTGSQNWFIHGIFA